MANKHLSISELIAPINIDDFFNEYWEKKHLHVQKQHDAYDGLFSLADIDSYLSMQNLKPEGLRLAKNGQQIPQDEWTKRTTILNGLQNIVVDPEQVLHHYNEGATIIISFADTMIPALANINRSIEQELGIKSQANVYITPPNAQGFTQHYDTHDIFLLQLKGPKIWNIYDTGEELPTTIKPFTKEPELVEKITINTGDFLYIPRGVVHEAFSSETATVHINFSLKPRYGFHLIESLAEIAEADDVFFRQVLPHKYSSDQQKEAYISMFQEKLKELLDKHTVEDLIERQKAFFREKQSIDLSGRLQDAVAQDQISADTAVCRCTGFTYHVATEAQSTIITFGKKKVTLPKFVDKELLLQDTPFKVKDIKGLLTEDNKMILVRSLIQSGYLRIVE